MVAMRIAELYPSGWHTARVDRIEAPTRPAAVSPRVLARWVLLCAVIAGVFVLHVLTSEHDHNGHGDPVARLATGHVVTHLGAGAATGPDNTTAAPIEATISDPVTPIGGDGGWLSGCILFLVVTGTGALLTLAMRRRAEGSAAAVMGVGGVMTRRGPPPGRVRRLGLAVIRV